MPHLLETKVGSLDSFDSNEDNMAKDNDLRTAITRNNVFVRCRKWFNVYWMVGFPLDDLLSLGSGIAWNVHESNECTCVWCWPNANSLRLSHGYHLG